MTNEQIHSNAIVAIKDMFRKYKSEHTINGVLCSLSGAPLDEPEDKNFYCLSGPSWLLHVSNVANNVGLDLICDQVGFNFYRVKDVWVRDQASYWPARLELLRYVSHHTAGGLVYILPPDERPVWEVVADDDVREEFVFDLVSLVDQMARRPSRYNEK